jgi:protein-S-isoprenylcysteine O-methyltransferase Ste14
MADLPPASYVSMPPPRHPSRRGRHVAFAIAVVVLAVLLVVAVVMARTPADPDYIGFRWTIRGLLLAIVAAVGGLIWSVRDAKQEERVWQKAMVAPDDHARH